MSQKIAFVQPCSLGDSNGGARILRSLIKEAPLPVISCNTSHWPGKQELVCPEFHLPFRPYFGRLERTRFASLPSMLDYLWLRRWLPRFRRLLLAERVTHLHVIPHMGLDFLGALKCARELSLSLSVSIHDHPRYCFRGLPGLGARLEAVREIWAEATGRFVISDQMGLAMNAEFGSQPFKVITDGVETAPHPAKTFQAGHLDVYFMGLFHQAYRANLQCLLTALGELRRRTSELKIRLTLRCGSIPEVEVPDGIEIQVLPFAPESVVQQDMAAADLLYLPLPFGDAYHEFTAYSLSTKMVTYLGSGRVILFHGPEESAAGTLLKGEAAALVCPSLDPISVADVIASSVGTCSRMEALVTNALCLAGERFRLEDIRSRFWRTTLGKEG